MQRSAAETLPQDPKTACQTLRMSELLVFWVRVAGLGYGVCASSTWRTEGGLSTLSVPTVS